MEETNERVDGGTLPDWEVADLPAPPRYKFGLAFAGILGPGIIALGASIGSGEWLLGPAITAQYGGTLLWIATISIVLQSFLNTEAIRYTLYTGEPMLSGYMRCKPGPRFWAVLYSGVDFFSVWPGWAMTAATALAAAWLGRMPTSVIATPGGADDAAVLAQIAADENTVRIFAYLIFFGCIAIVMFGKKIYNSLEKVLLFMVVWIIGYLVVIDLFLVHPKTWWVVIKGFFSFGALPDAVKSGGFDWSAIKDLFNPSVLSHAIKIQEFDWLLLGAFAAYAGSGGLGNITISNYVRDKGWGMSSLVGAIPSIIGGQNVKLSHLGKVFRITPENLEKFKEWWKYVRFEQYYVWLIGCFIGLALPAMLTIAHVDSGEKIGQWDAAALQAEGLSEKGSLVLESTFDSPGLAQVGGRVLWYLTLLCGFWVLFSTQLGGVDGVPRRFTDIIWTGFSKARRMDEHDAKWIYYPILAVYIVWGVIAMYLAKPLFMIIVSATIGGFQLVMCSIHTFFVNRRFLPKEIQPPIWKQIGLLLCAGFYSIFAVISIYIKVIEPYILPIFR